jgi:hypothetical protein
MKTLLLLLFPLSLFAQIDYPRGMEFISTKTPKVTVTWIKESSRKVPLYLNQWVAFVNTKSDQILASRIEVTVIHNDDSIQSFDFKVGESLAGHIYTHRPIKLKIGDKVAIHFKLIPTSKEESYVFSIFEQHLKTTAPTKSVSVTSVQKEVLVKRHETKNRKIPNNELKRIRRNRTALAILTILTH